MSTNSIIIANLPDWTATAPKVESNGETNNSQYHDPSHVLPSTFLESLRAVIEVHRDIIHWVPVRRSSASKVKLTTSFRRIFCVFVNSDDAELVKVALNGCIFEGHRLDVYFGEVHPSSDHSLHRTRL
jgi:hypothetical protein